MRAPTLITAALLVSTPASVACNGDQEATTAPNTLPSLFVSRKSYSFSLSCSNAGASTVALVTIVVSSTISGDLAPLNCGGQITNISNFKSVHYRITLTDQTDQQVAVCINNKPIRNPGSVVCGTGQASAVLTVAS